MFFFNPRQILSSDTFEQLGELLRETIAVSSMVGTPEVPQQGTPATSAESQHSQAGVTALSDRPSPSELATHVVAKADVAKFLNTTEHSPIHIALNPRLEGRGHKKTTWRSLRFTLVASDSFKALLLGQMTGQGKEFASSSSHHSQSGQAQDGQALQLDLARSNWLACDLLFEPEAIASFMHCLLLQVDPTAPIHARLACILERVNNGVPNDPALQSRFTLELMNYLQRSAPSPKEPSFPQQSAVPESGEIRAELTQRTQILHDAMLAAQAADKAKSEFLAAMSHELRTPLTYILGMSSTLLRWSEKETDGADSSSIRERQHRYLQNIHDQGEHLLELINDILDLSQLESGKMSLDLHDCSLSLIAQQTLKSYMDRAKEKRIRLQLNLEISSELDQFTADPRRLRQILLNLLSNAVKFTPESGTVTLRVTSDPGSATFQVKDTGIGIPDHLQADVFQKFRQLDSSYRRQYDGTGLGLALTKQLVDLHGGRIECESTVNVGTVFTVTLPRTPFVQSRHEESSVPEINTQPLGRIVLIESQDESAHLVSDMLTAAGYQLIWMLEGWTAVTQIEMLQPAVILVGTCLSDADSCEVIRQIRRNPLTKHFKIMALGSITTPHTTEHFLQAGVDEFLSYPMRPEDLLHAVSLLMATTATARETISP